MNRVKNRVFSGAIWEKQVAYCRAIKAGEFVLVSGTTSVDENSTIIGENVYEQSIFIFKKIEKALEEFNINISNVVRTRMFITNIDAFDELAKAHKEVFNENPPVATCVEVSRFVDEKLLIEIEVDAYYGET